MMKKNKYKIGIIGCGRWGGTHLKIIRNILNRSQILISDTDKNKLNNIAHLANKVYTNFKEMINENPDLRAVFITAPTISHYMIAKYCLESGLDVFIEKPITLNSEEAYKLIKLSKKKNKLLVPGHIFLYKKAFQIIKKEFDEKYHDNFIISKRINNGPNILDEGAIFDLAVHDIYLMINLFENVPISVYACKINKNGALVNAAIILKFDKGIINISVGWTGLTSTREMHIFNKQKEFLWKDSEPQSLIIKSSRSNKRRSFKRKKIDLFGPYNKEKVYKNFNENALLKEDKLFLKSLKTRKPFVDPFEAYITVKIMEKISLALKTGKEVKI